MQIARQYAFLHDVGLLAFHTFVVEVDRAAVEGDGTVVHHVDVLVAHLLAQQVAEDRRFLTVEVGLESMTDGLVQQDTRTAGSHHNGHFAAFGLDGLEEDGRIVHRFASQCRDNVVA